MRSIHAGFLLLLSLALLHACVAQPEREQVSPLIRITRRPEPDAVRVAYALPTLASSFTFPNSAADIRTDTWRTTDGTLGRTEITFPAPVDGFDITMTPDLKDRDRIYPGLVHVGAGWLVYPRHLMPRDNNQAFDISYALPDGCPLNGDSEVDTIAGLPFSDAEAIRDRLHELCASNGLVEFGWKRHTVAAAACTAELPPAKHVWKIVRAFGS